MTMRNLVAILFLSLSLHAQAAALPIANENVDVSVYLVGDAGQPNNPVLRALAADVEARIASLGAVRVAVIFLGDNEYRNGTAPGSPSAILAAQVKAANRNPAVQVIFVPGNHDWAQGKAVIGLRNVREQTRQLANGANVVMLPGNGCPGPAVRTLGTRLRVIALDTHWWLHPPSGRPNDCAQNTESEVGTALAAALRTAGGETIVVAHHPLRSGGQHGRLTNALFDRATVQDQRHPTNTRMRNALLAAFGAASPLTWVSGHEHTLEVQAGIGARHLLVSGAGNFQGISRVERAAEQAWVFPRVTHWRPRQGGYLRLDITRDGTASRVAIMNVANATATEFEAFALP